MKTTLAIRWLLRLVLLVATWPALAQSTGSEFDHLRTGFALTGQHGQVRCESCHVGGVFKGTPRECEACHTAGARLARGNVVKPAQHVTTQAPCDSCHQTRSFAGARMNHAAVARGSCATCHNGSQAAGKSADHLRTTAACDSCHTSTTSWSAAKVDHSGFSAATNCASCHNGASASGKPSTHIPVGAAACADCHTSTGWKPSRFNHTQLPVAGQCASCHSGNFPPADGKPAAHTPYHLVASLATASCDSCHKAGTTSWTPARLHASTAVTAQCSTCHLNARPGNATHAGQTVCETCHKSSSTWSGAKVDHAGFTAATNCANCHNGSNATGKPVSHIPVGATSCASCHGTTGWRPSGFNHTQLPVTAQCASCHTGSFPPADGKPATHTPYQLVATTAAANCDTCHKSGYVAWTPAKLHASTLIAAQCSTCHLSARPTNATHAGQTSCESCHKSTAAWTGAKVDHSGFTAATNCASCHNGSAATGKPVNHIPVGATSCFGCHSPTQIGWRPSRFNHTQVPVTAQCASCHSGSYPPADGKPAAHTPYQLVATTAAANCDTCHKAGYVAWTPARVHANSVITAQCSTCHLSARPATAIHAGQTVCETCHKSTTSWASAKVDHTTYTAVTNCTTCHNGSSATGKPVSHIPVGATNCFGCHSPTQIGWRPSRFNHTQVPVTAQCASCHTGSYPPADGRPAAHVPYQLVATTAAANCDTCHRSGYVAWTPAKVHANTVITAQCATCHLSARPATAIHAGQTTCETCHKSTTTWLGAKVDHSTFTAATNCLGCHNGSSATGKPVNHIPVGATSCFACHSPTQIGWRPSRFNHTQVPVTAQCASCHTGTYPPADGRPAAHLPYQLVATLAAANCDTCHRGSFTTWANGKVHANTTITGQCKTCHTTAYAAQGATAKPALHVPESQLLNGAAMECNACHTTTTSWSARMNHNNSLGGGAGWCKACHQSGTSYIGSMERKSITHRTKTPPAIDCSESGCHRPLGSKGTSFINWD